VNDNFEQDAIGSQLMDENKLGVVAIIAKRQMQEEDEVKCLEVQLANAKAKLYKTQTTELPQAMAQLQLSSITLDNGAVIRIQPFFEASIPSATAIDKAKGEDKKKLAERALACYGWLRAHGYDALIKREVVASFGRGEDNIAGDLVGELRERGLLVYDKSSVHPSTLKSFVKERVEMGDSTFPLDTFGVTIGNISKIERT
jgi:hypothetical protein